jgi:uracil-DNA glycosylase
MFLAGREDLSLRVMRRSQLRYVDAKRDLTVPLIATYHPAYVLRRESESTEDLDAMILGDIRKAMSLARPS